MIHTLFFFVFFLYRLTYYSDEIAPYKDVNILPIRVLIKILLIYSTCSYYSINAIFILYLYLPTDTDKNIQYLDKLRLQELLLGKYPTISTSNVCLFITSHSKMDLFILMKFT